MELFVARDVIQSYVIQRWPDVTSCNIHHGSFHQLIEVTKLVKARAGSLTIIHGIIVVVEILMKRWQNVRAFKF